MLLTVVYYTYGYRLSFRTEHNLFRKPYFASIAGPVIVMFLIHLFA
jgi:hypothetical protein